MVKCMNINYDSYRVFYHVAKYGGFTKAANALGGNQSNITRTIKNLEIALGCKLFFRSNRGAQLTPEGEKLYAHVSVAFEHIRAGEEEVASRQSLQSGLVTVAASEVALHCCLLPVLKTYRTRYPGVRIHVSNHSSYQALDVLRDGLADFAVISTPEHLPKSLHWRKIMDIQELPIAGNGFAFLRGKSLTLKEVVQHPLVGLGIRTATFDFYDRIFSEEGLSFRPNIEAATADQILPMVKSDLGIGFVPEVFAQDDILAENVFVISLETFIPKRSICLLTRKDRPLSIAARELERMIMAV